MDKIMLSTESDQAFKESLDRVLELGGCSPDCYSGNTITDIIWDFSDNICIEPGRAVMRKVSVAPEDCCPCYQDEGDPSYLKCACRNLTVYRAILKYAKNGKAFIKAVIDYNRHEDAESALNVLNGGK